MLTAKAGGDAPAPNFTEEEDSGLIDLKALAAGLSSESVLSAPLDVTGGGGVFPLGAPVPVMPAPRIEEEPKQGINKGLVVGLGAIVVALGAAVVFLVVRGSGPPPTAPTPTVVTVYAPAPTPDMPPEPTAEASASASASASAAAKGGKGRLTPGTKSTAAGDPGSPGTAATPAKPKGGNPCGCDPNDLMCNMRCSQKK
jgi:hypothetical protein